MIYQIQLEELRRGFAATLLGFQMPKLISFSFLGDWPDIG